MRAIIIGGGIAGLACALALTRRGWQVEVFERAPEFTEVGAGLSLWPNALRALDALEVGEGVRGRAVLEGQAGIQDAEGRWLARTDTAELERRHGPVPRCVCSPPHHSPAPSLRSWTGPHDLSRGC